MMSKAACLFALCCAATQPCAHGIRMQEPGRNPRRKMATTERISRSDAIAQALQVVENSGSEDLRKLVDSLRPVDAKRVPDILKSIQKGQRTIESTLKKDEAALRRMSGGDSPSMELLSLMSTFESIFNEQWMGERLPTNELTKGQIEEIQAKHFNMGAVDFAKQMIENWQAQGPAEFQDPGFDRRLVEVTSMLRYDSANQHLTYSSHFWLHLTNTYMLLVRSIKDLLEPRDPTRRSNIGNVGRTGADDCNAAVIEAKHAFRKGGSEKGLKLMQYGVKFLLEKHMQAAHDIFVNLPSIKSYLGDQELMLAFRQAQAAFVEEWSNSFETEYQKFLYMVTTNIQQGKVLKMLNTMALETEEKGAANLVQEVKISKCSDVSGAVSRQDAKFPLCKCKDYKANIFCGTEAILEEDEEQRKFNASFVKENPACKYSMPYCSAAANQHQLTDLAKLLNPKPENCETLYDELVDSSIDILVNNVGSLMYFLAYDAPETPIVKRNGFAMQLFERLKGDGMEDMISEDILQSRFPTLGQKKILTERVMKMKSDIADMKRATDAFQRVYSAAPN